MQEHLLILGDQLFDKHPLLKRDVSIIMIESKDLCQRYTYHKFKIAYVLTCMREYRDNLRRKGYQVQYYQLEQHKSFSNIFQEKKVTRLRYIEPTDKQFRKYLREITEKQHIETFITKENPMFLTPTEELIKTFQNDGQNRMHSFYINQRKRLTLFVDSKQKPYQGSWSLDKQNRKKIPKKHTFTGRKTYTSAHYNDVKKTIQTTFSDHPGNLPDLYIPVSRRDSLEHLETFFTQHLRQFGDYEDAIDSREPFLNHSILSPLLNNGLLTPEEIIDSLVDYCNTHPDILESHYNSVEGFVRQIIGWREWMWGLYNYVYDGDLSRYNFFEHSTDLPDYFYFDKIDLIDNPPLQDTLEKVNQYGYSHHIERLMILSNWMVLNEYDPKQCYQWFMEMFVDAYDWVMVGNVYGMGLFADGGIFATKPYISSSNYLRKMSHYKKGSWQEQWDSKFWKFLFKHEKFFEHQPRMNMLIKKKKPLK